MGSNWAARVNSHIWGQGKQSDGNFHPRQSMGELGQKDSAGLKHNLCFIHVIKRVQEQILKLWKIQSGQDVEEQGQEDLQPESPREAPCHSLQKGLSPRSMRQFWKTESSFWHQNRRSGHIGVFFSLSLYHQTSCTMTKMNTWSSFLPLFWETFKHRRIPAVKPCFCPS